MLTSESRVHQGRPHSKGHWKLWGPISSASKPQHAPSWAPNEVSGGALETLKPMSACNCPVQLLGSTANYEHNEFGWHWICPRSSDKTVFLDKLNQLTTWHCYQTYQEYLPKKLTIHSTIIFIWLFALAASPPLGPPQPHISFDMLKPLRSAGFFAQF